ncbi:hypothetical protein H0H92_002810, partial [Tricholoma furcatifolium]
MTLPVNASDTTRSKRTGQVSHRLADPDNIGDVQLRSHQLKRAQELEAQRLRTQEKDQQEDQQRSTSTKRNASAAELNTSHN